MRSTDTALHAFKRSHAWREAAKVRGRAGGRGARRGSRQGQGDARLAAWRRASIGSTSSWPRVPQLAPFHRLPACPALPPRPCQASAPLASQDIAGPPVLPSTFLREAVAGFLDRLRQHQAAVAELEAVLVAGGGEQAGVVG